MRYVFVFISIGQWKNLCCRCYITDTNFNFYEGWWYKFIQVNNWFLENQKGCTTARKFDKHRIKWTRAVGGRDVGWNKLNFINYKTHKNSFGQKNITEVAHLPLCRWITVHSPAREHASLALISRDLQQSLRCADCRASRVHEHEHLQRWLQRWQFFGFEKTCALPPISKDDHSTRGPPLVGAWASEGGQGGFGLPGFWIFI